MDFDSIRLKSFALRDLLLSSNISADLILLFGSYAKGTPREDSDIDFAVISRDFGNDYFEESVKLNLNANSIDSRIEAIPIGLNQYFDDDISPILYEIRKNGIPMF